MKQSSILRRFGLYAIGLLAVGIILLTVFQGNYKFSDKNNVISTKRAKIERLDKNEKIGKSLRLSEDPENILSIVKHLEKPNSLQLAEIETRLILKLNLFSHSQLGSLVVLSQQFGLQKLNLAIRKRTSKFESSEALLEFFNQTLSCPQFNSQALYELGKNSELLSVDKMSHTISILDKVHGLDTKSLGFGLATRINNLPERMRDQAARDYLAIAGVSSLSAPITKVFVENQIKKDPKSAENLSKWILGQEAGLVRDADSDLVKMFAEVDHQIAIDYINSLIESNQIDRASKSARAFSEKFASKHPREAFEWSLNLPSDFKNRPEAIGSAFATLVRSDPEQALKLMESVKDEKMRGNLETIRDFYIKEPSLPSHKPTRNPNGF